MSHDAEAARLARFAGKRVLIVSPGVPHPRRGASTVLFFEYIRGIATAGCEVLQLLLMDRTNQDSKLLAEYEAEVEKLSQLTAVPCAFDRLYRLERYSRAPRVSPLPAEIGVRAREFAPDLILSFDILCAACAKQLGLAAPHVVWLGDLNFETFWYHALYEAAERPMRSLQLPRMWYECRAWRAFYRDTLQDASLVVVASKSSERALRGIAPRRKYLPYPWPLHDDARVTGPAAGSLPSFVFFGQLTGLGSRSAFHMLLDELYPRLLSTWGAKGFRILLAGVRDAPQWVRTAIQNKAEIAFLGFVDNLGALLSSCHAVLIPIKVPVGNRSRIITAMAYGALVIAHRNTALGNAELVSGENCLLAENAGEFIEHLQFAVDATDRATEIGRRARSTYERTFEPRAAVTTLLNEIAPLLDRARAVA